MSDRGAKWTTRQGLRLALVGTAFWAATGAPASAQTVDIEVPSGVSFSVTDASVSTVGLPDPATLGFSNADLAGESLRVSVRADGPGFTPPSGLGIRASIVSWTVASQAGGTGWPGTLSSFAYTVVFESDPDAVAGHVNLSWLMAPLADRIRAGTHTLTIRWMLESVKM